MLALVIALSVLVGAAVLLGAPSDPGTRLRELLPKSTTRDGGTAADRDGGRQRTDPDQEKLWAIGAVENCAHLLKVGMTPHAVMVTLSRQNVRLRPIARAISLGEDPGRAIASHHESLPQSAAEVFAGMAAVWTVSERSGAPAAEMILRYAQAQRNSLDADRERRIAMAGPAATVRVLSWLPLIGVGLGLLIGVRPMELISGLPGQLSIGSGVVLYAVGRTWMRRMMVRARR